MSENKEAQLSTPPTLAELKELKQIPKYKHLYIFEVQFFDKGGEFIHQGYMNRIFYSKQDAALYYQLYNPEMRVLNKCGDCISDVHKENNLRYKLVIYNLEKLTIIPFDKIISSYGWVKKSFSDTNPSKQPANFELGKVLGKGANSPVGEFPLCNSDLCWCYDCALEATKPENYETHDYDVEFHRLAALRMAKRSREKYVKEHTLSLPST